MPFDQSSFMSLVEGDKELAGTLLELYAEDWPKIVTGIETAINDGQHKQVEQLAHRLKGNLRNFFANDSAEMAMVMEESGRNNELGKAQEVLDQLKPKLKELEEELKNFYTSLG